ncbi:hypothetical protein [Acidicapsa ligni]|uniref:hypothetical protein n=1 Tax=Acidicapsa ligni TaxID=542300 RepID=UPI0021E0C749|nr:hypothetical protein [Acidicapsa ligni]
MATAPSLPKSFEDAARRHLIVEEELERLCASSHFRTSKRSCEFLQYIVRVTLNGRTDSLKERSIGIDLFGRDTSYEPSSDATVRVRANEVRKRLTSYYASSVVAAEIRIDLPTGSYVPHFLPGIPADSVSAAAPELETQGFLREASLQSFPQIKTLTLMRPALFALLICTLLLRHQLEDREEYLRFWDRLLAGRSALLLSVTPPDRDALASSLYPLVWVAGRYGVATAIDGDSLTGTSQGALATVQVSYETPAPLATDGRIRWALSGSQPHLIDRDSSSAGSLAAGPSVAVLTILPEESATLHVQGTDGDAIRQLLQELISEKEFPGKISEELENRHTFQMLLFHDAAGQWQRRIFKGRA